ncbi:MAG: alpha/beta fold hydrolase [Bacteroidota bacterium]
MSESLALNSKVMGAGPALLILHGLFGSLDNWLSHAKTLSEDFTVHLLDQRNHGRSPHADDWTYPLMAEDLLTYMDAEGIMTASLLGHSMGGKTALTFADAYPERLEKLIIADITPKQYKPHHDEIIEALLSVPLKEVSQRSEVDEILKKSINEISVRQFLLKGLGRNKEKSFAWKFNLEVISQNYEEVLKEIPLEDPNYLPTLFIYGAKSNYLNEDDLESLPKLFPLSQFVGVPDAGHWLHAENPSAFIKEVQDFLYA